MTNLHIDTLVALNGAADFGLPVDNLLADLRRGRHRGLSLPQLEKALRDLADKSFATPFDSELSGQRWRVTGRGKSALAEEGIG
jgi:hypothetical protein